MLAINVTLTAPSVLLHGRSGFFAVVIDNSSTRLEGNRPMRQCTSGSQPTLCACQSSSLTLACLSVQGNKMFRAVVAAVAAAAVAFAQSATP